MKRKKIETTITQRNGKVPITIYEDAVAAYAREGSEKTRLFMNSRIEFIIDIPYEDYPDG